jgi:hypothetical protein
MTFKVYIGNTDGGQIIEGHRATGLPDFPVMAAFISEERGETAGSFGLV